MVEAIIRIRCCYVDRALKLQDLPLRPSTKLPRMSTAGESDLFSEKLSKRE